VVFNAVFFIYIFTAQWPLLRAVVRAMEGNQTNIGVGIILILVSFAELVGIHLKLPVVNLRIGKRKIRRFGLFFIIWVFHIVINMSLVLYGLKATGIFFDSDRLGWIAMAAAFFVVIKELYLLIYFQFKPRIKKQVTEHQLQVREFWGDALIFCWSAVAFTVTWVYAATSMPIWGNSIGFIIAQLFGVCFIFLMMFLPLRLLQFYEEWSLPRTKRQKAYSWLSLAANVAGAMIMLLINSPRW